MPFEDFDRCMNLRRTEADDYYASCKRTSLPRTNA